MKKSVLGLFIVIAACVSSGYSQKVADSQISKLLGVWRVDLRPTPDAAEYFQEFEITQIDSKAFTGKFYGTEIKNGKVNVDWGTVSLAFTSEDGAGIYSHFAKFVGDRIEGATHGIGRGFLLPWRAERKPQEAVKTKKVN